MSVMIVWVCKAYDELARTLCISRADAVARPVPTNPQPGRLQPLVSDGDDLSVVDRTKLSAARSLGVAGGRSLPSDSEAGCSGARLRHVSRYRWQAARRARREERVARRSAVDECELQQDP